MLPSTFPELLRLASQPALDQDVVVQLVNRLDTGFSFASDHRPVLDLLWALRAAGHLSASHLDRLLRDFPKLSGYAQGALRHALLDADRGGAYVQLSAQHLVTLTNSRDRPLPERALTQLTSHPASGPLVWEQLVRHLEWAAGAGYAHLTPAGWHALVRAPGLAQHPEWADRLVRRLTEQAAEYVRLAVALLGRPDVATSAVSPEAITRVAQRLLIPGEVQLSPPVQRELAERLPPSVLSRIPTSVWAQALTTTDRDRRLWLVALRGAAVRPTPPLAPGPGRRA